MQKFRDVLSRWEARELSAMDAAELIGCSERHFRRLRKHFDEEGLEDVASARGEGRADRHVREDREQEGCSRRSRTG